MPYSSIIFDSAITNFFKFVHPQTFLDIGAGAGKYGEMTRKVDKSIHSIALEIEKDYVSKFGLGSMYDEIWVMPASDLIDPIYYDNTFDVIMLGDVIEHLKKSDGVNLLNFLIYRCRWIVIEFPHHYLQNSVGGYNAEAHISTWSETDFGSFEATRVYKNDTQRLVILRGYLEDRVSIDDVESILNK